MVTDTGGREGSTSHGGAAGGWMTFAGVLMVLGGFVSVFSGISAIAHDDVFVATRNYVFQFNLTGWGWIHLIIGVVLVLAGFALFKGAVWARVLGVVLAGLGLIANFLWLPHHPFWALVLIAIDVFVIWALCVAPRPAKY